MGCRVRHFFGRVCRTGIVYVLKAAYLQVPGLPRPGRGSVYLHVLGRERRTERLAVGCP